MSNFDWYLPAQKHASMMIVVALLAVFNSGCASQSEPPLEISSKSAKDFSGNWELDYAMSENPNDKLRWLYEVTRSQAEQADAARRDSAGAGRAIGLSREAVAAIQGVINLGRLTEKISRSTVLDIKQTGDNVVVKREGDFALTCDFMESQKLDNNLGAESCGWQDDELIFKVKLPEGLDVTQRLVLSGNGKRLNVSTSVSSKSINQPFTLNRVYMPFEPGESMYNCKFTLAKKKTCRLGTE